jgi:hypothetical protein
VALLASIAVAALTFVAFFAYVKLVGPGLTVLMTCVTFALTAWMITLVTSPFAVFPASSFRTYRGLVTQLVALNYSKLSARYQSWNETDVWAVLQTIIVEQLGVKKEEVTPEATFVEDLRCD